MNDLKLRLSKVDEYLVDTFEGLIKVGLALLCYVSPIVLLALLTVSIASFMSSEWLDGVFCLFLILLSIYTVRGLIPLIKNKNGE